MLYSPTNFLSSFHISQDAEAIVQASVWLLQLKRVKVKLKHSSWCETADFYSQFHSSEKESAHHLHHVIQRSIDHPAGHTVMTIELWEIWAVDEGLLLQENNSSASCSETHTCAYTHTHRPRPTQKDISVKLMKQKRSPSHKRSQ